jgi:LysM repeat protein
MLDENGGIHVLDTLTGFSDGPSSQNYVVQAGDTLAGIAQAVYGNSQYGYLVADANGMTGDNDLVVGQAITLPSITTSSNTSSTFKPYNPNAIVGSTTPSLPTPPPPPPGLRCQDLSQIIAVAVTIIVGYFAESSAAGAAAGNLAGQYSSMMFNHQFDWHRAEQFAVNPFSGNASDFARSIYDPPGNGAPGKADYKSAAIAAAAAEVGSYAGSFAGAAGSVSNAVVSAGAQYVTSVELGKAAGYDTSFSLRELGTTMGTAYAGVAISNAVGAGPIAYQDVTTGATIRTEQPFSWGLLVKQATADVLTQGANYALRKAAGLSASWDWGQVGADVFGNALGNGLIGGIKSYQANQLPPIDVAMDPIDVGMPTHSALTGGDISQSIAPVGSAQLSSYTVQSGDTLSGIAGTSDPEVIGMLMQLNGLTSSTIQPGMQLQLGDLSDYSLGQIAQFGQSGQAILDQDNAALAARSSQGNIDSIPWLQLSGGSEASKEQIYLSASAGNPTLPAIERDYYVEKGYFEQAQDIAIQGYNDPSNSYFQRGVFAVLGGLEEPLSLAEGAVRGMMNVPSDASIAAQNFAAASMTHNADDRLTYFGQGLGAAGTGLLNLSGAGGLLDSMVAGSLFDVSLGGAPSNVDAGNVIPTGPYIKLGSDEAIAAQRAYAQTFNSENTLVIGRLPDTAVGEELGMTRLNEPNWTENVNDAWIQGGVDAQKPFYLGSDISIGNLRSGNPIFPKTVYFRELQQLRGAGYYREGDFMMPPKGN